jgi:hypothetical protein
MPRHSNTVEAMTPNYIEKLTAVKTISTIPFMNSCNFKKIGSYLGRTSVIKNLISSLNQN